MSSSGDEGHRAVESAGAASRRPGHELGAARERAGIPLEEMATRLHLTRDSVEALERDDYDHLPTATFVRGYLRAYAKEVGMDGDALVAEFDAVSGHIEDPELVLSEGMPDPGSGHGPTIAILILVAVVVIGAGAWWFQQPAVTPSAEPETLPETAGGDAVETETGDVAGAPELEPEAEGQGTAEPETPDADSEAGTSAETEAMDETADAATPETEDTASGGSVDDARAVAEGETSAQDTVETEDVTSEAPATADGNTATGTDTGEPGTGGPLATSDAELAATSAADTGPDRVEISVDGESWIEVYDSRGRRLVYTLYSGSNPVVLNGWGPFDVFLGNSPAVTVRIDEEVIDQSAFVRSDNTARFLADSEGARRR